MAKSMQRRTRTKEELIAAQRGANEAQAEGTEIYDQATAPAMRGDAASALEALAWQAGRLWELGALGGFDLRRVDEQGLLLDSGWLALPVGPGARRCSRFQDGAHCQGSATHGFAQAGDPGPRWCAEHAGAERPPHEEACLTWKAGEHLDEVLDRGRTRIVERAREALEKPVPLPENIVRAVSTLKPGELLVLEADPQGLRRDARERLLRAMEVLLVPMGAKAIVLEGPVRRESVEHLREVLRPVGYDVVPSKRVVPETREAFFDALGVEDGVAYPGLRERIAEWLKLPLTEEQATLEEEAHRRLVAQRCRRCPDVFEEIVCQCSPTRSRVVAKADAFPGKNGWRCASCTASEALAALNNISGMLDLPACGRLPDVVPVAVLRVLRSVHALISAARAGFTAALPVLTVEQRTWLEDLFRPLVMTLADPEGDMQATAHRISQETLDAIAEDLGKRADLLLERGTSEVGTAVRSQLQNTPEEGTFADLVAAGKPAIVLVLEQDHSRCVRLLERLLDIGGAKVKGLAGGGDRFAFGPVTVWIAHRPEQALGWSRGADAVVGFDEERAQQLLDGSSLRLAVAAADAPRFWGLAP